MGLPRRNLFPVLPLRDIVIFPHMVLPLFVGRQKSVRALEIVRKDDTQILLVTQRNATQDDPTPADIYSVGTVGTVLQLLKLPDGTVKVLVESGQRARTIEYRDDPDFFQAYVEITQEDLGDEHELGALARTVVGQFERYIKLNKKIPPEVMVLIGQIDDPSKLADTVAAHLSLKIPEKQELLESESVSARLEKVYGFMESEIGVLQVDKRIRSRVKRQMEKSQHEYLLNEQLRAIQKELGEGEDGDELTELEDTIQQDQALQGGAREGARRAQEAAQHEPDVARDHRGAQLPRLDAVDPLEEAHQDREGHQERPQGAGGRPLRPGQGQGADPGVPRRAAAHAQGQGPILCLVGPPGVGKTSLGKSIARATGRNFVRMSLGGIRDEAEIRGHRRTYVGSMPGKVIQGMKKAKSSNPLFLLDEVDKLGADWRGDPSSALLEVLDPEQNSTFNDHYLEVDYDLSDVMFVTTANTLRIPPPLLDRMETIRLPGYTEDEKVEIAKRHLIAKQMKAHGIKEQEWSISEEALRDMIRYYTREAGVRNLEREIANLIRKAVKEIALGKCEAVRLTRRNLEKFAGVRRYRFGEAELEDLVGVATGLAWTEVGGELLQIEAVTAIGKGKVSSTGKLGDVMKESIQAAEYFIKSRSVPLGIKPTFFENRDIHVHIPEGAIPKDGPSAGVAIVTSIVSVLTGIPVRREVAMTGEITLRGRVLPIDGLKEKLLAAHRGGIKTVLIPKDNEKDLADIPDNLKRGIKIVATNVIDEVLEHALVSKMPRSSGFLPLLSVRASGR